MSSRHLSLLVLLASLWGASFLFIRIGVAEFGVAPLMALRVGLGAAFLLGLALTRLGAATVAGTLRRHARPLLICGLLNSAAPFCLFAFAELTLQAGLTSVINATAPLWAALIAYLWLGERLAMSRVLGLVTGFAGVLLLVGQQIFAASDAGAAAGAAGGALVAPGATLLAAAAALGATLLYGIAANYTKRRLAGVDALLNASGTMLGATALLLPFALATWPAALPSARAWGAVIALGLLCTGLAYLIFFHLIAQVGPARTITVTFVIPIFGILWGALFLGEAVSATMLAGCAVVLLGTALATGTIRVPGVGPRREPLG